MKNLIYTPLLSGNIKSRGAKYERLHQFSDARAENGSVRVAKRFGVSGRVGRKASRGQFVVISAAIAWNVGVCGVKAASEWSNISSSSFSTDPWPAGIALIIGSKFLKS